MTVKLDELLKRHKKDRGEMKQLATARLHEVFTTAFIGIPDLKLVRVQGYTPGFNDGDPCVHSMKAAVDIYDPEEIFYEYFDSSAHAVKNDPRLALLSGTERFHQQWDSKTRKHLPPEDPFHAALIKVCDLIYALADDFQLLYDTNFQVDIIRTDNEESLYEVEVGEYDCGY